MFSPERLQADNVNLLAENERLKREIAVLKESGLLPAAKFLSNTLDEQMVHITEEYAEVYKAFENYVNNNVLSSEDDIEDEAMYEVFAHEDAAAKDRLAEELVDLQTSAETMLEIFGLNYFDRLAVRKRVIEKNRARGYYQEVRESGLE